MLEGEGFDMQTRVRTFLNRYVDFNFDIDIIGLFISTIQLPYISAENELYLDFAKYNHIANSPLSINSLVACSSVLPCINA